MQADTPGGTGGAGSSLIHFLARGAFRSRERTLLATEALAFIDPYNLEFLSFSLLKKLSELRKIDLAINFSTMDLQRNVELEFDPNRARFDETAPGSSLQRR